LSRLALTNRHFGDDVHFEGITLAAGNNPSIVTSQTFIKGDDPTVAEVHQFMKAAGFESVLRDLIRSKTVVWHNAQRLQRLRAELGGLLRLYNVAFRPPRRSFWAVLLGAQAITPSSSGKTLKGKAVHTVVGGR
jgi:hypothetical protein